LPTTYAIYRLSVLKPFDPEGAFRAATPTREMRKVAVRSVGATLFSGGLGLVIQIVSTVALARLLAPRDFGLVTMVSTFSLLLANFGLNGLTEAIVQRDDVNHTLASNLFWINVGGSLALTLVFAAAGSSLARFYGDPRIIGVTQAMSITIFLTGFSVIHLALLKRAMRFTVVSANEVVARAATVVVAILLGWAGWGYWALVAGNIAYAASSCVGGWVFCRWIPGPPARDSHTPPAVRFAINTYGRFMTGYFSNNFDNFLVGWRLGATPLGYYKKAFDLFVLPTNQLSLGLTTVAVSALSRFQRDLVQYRRYFLSSLGVMAFVGMGLSADLTLVGKDLILVLLGPKWGESGRIFTLFGPGIGAMILYCTHIWIHLSIGRADRWFRWGLVDLVVTAVFLGVGLHWGAEGIAIAWVAAYWVITWPALSYAGQPIHLGIVSVMGAVWKYVLAASAAGAGAFAILKLIPSLELATGTSGALLRLVSVSAIITSLYFAGVALLHGGWGPIYQIGGLLREMVSTSKTSSPPRAFDSQTEVMEERKSISGATRKTPDPSIG
jgi:O-antigen/teichoic acid export membrane protein